MGCCVATVSDVWTRGCSGSTAARPENGKLSRCGVWCRRQPVSSGARASTGGGRLCDGGHTETGIGYFPGDVWVCGHVSWRPTSCRNGHYLFSDYDTVVPDDAGEIDLCPNTVAAGILIFPGAGCRIAMGRRVAAIRCAVSGDGYRRGWGGGPPVVNRPGRRIGLRRGRFGSRQGVRRCSGFFLWAILSLLVGCRVEGLGGCHCFIFRQQFGRQFASWSLSLAVGSHGDGLRDGGLVVYQPLPVLAEIVSENGHVPVGMKLSVPAESRDKSACSSSFVTYTHVLSWT